MEYRTEPKRMVWSVFTIRVVPSAMVCGAAGSTCSRARSSARASAGTRAVSRCRRALTLAVNASQAASSSTKEAYWPRRFTSVGTALTSATALRVVRSPPA